MPIAKANATNVERSESSEDELQFSDTPIGDIQTGHISNPPQFQGNKTNSVQSNLPDTSPFLH